jgi:hypothetical protein
VEIAQVGDPIVHTPKVDTHPTTWDHPPFILPIPKPLIDLYQIGNDAIRIAQQDALHTVQQLLHSNQVTTEQIDLAATMVVEAIDGYHELAQTIWPMAHPPTSDETTKLHHHHKIRHKTTKTHHTTQKHAQQLAPQIKKQCNNRYRPKTHKTNPNTSKRSTKTPRHSQPRGHPDLM